jgi:SET domain-containing protein
MVWNARSPSPPLFCFSSCLNAILLQVAEYVGEVVGLRMADKREAEYLSNKRLQYKGACYLFRIDDENIIDATRKGGIARFVNHSCSVSSLF